MILFFEYAPENLIRQMLYYVLYDVCVKIFASYFTRKLQEYGSRFYIADLI